MDINLIRILQTVFLFALFLGLVYLLYRKTDQKTFEEAANLPFLGDETSNIIEKRQNRGENHE
ncbi:MAG: CcoQ/FixQ family Cbb3-type cytochrome c oxidase assembly chaperone [Kangiella sp.]|nr:MAG: CcoQ/FixQ family Cbb3-type cytochrome c oxidase assembly chaperone [Kangiella sp.]